MCPTNLPKQLKIRKYFTLIITPPVFQKFDLSISSSESDNFKFLLDYPFLVCTQSIICTFDRKLIFNQAHIFQITTVEQSILNLLFPLLHLRHGSTLGYQCIQAKTIALHLFVRKQYFQYLWPRKIKIIY